MQLETAKVRSLWAPQFWRHPVLWWKTRPIRRFVRDEAKRKAALSPEMRELEQEFDEKYERDLLFGADPEPPNPQAMH